MVYFTCNRCGTSLKKNQVVKHFGCRPLSLGCLDCFKDFTEETYVAHTKCISEQEKYSGKGFVPSQSFNKGEKKQAAWTESIRAILDSNVALDNEERKIFELIINFDNIPRKKAKFQNFLKNVHKNVSIKTMEKVWNKIEEQIKPKTDNSQQNNSLNNSNLNDTQNTNELDISKQNDETKKDEKIEEDVESKKLSKKEKKEKKKRAKYECELKQVESNENVEEEPEESKKKKKKGKKGQDAQEMESTEQVNGKKSKKNKIEETQETKVKLSKKRKLEINEEDEPAKKKSNGVSNEDYINQNEIEENESIKPGKFPWTDKITEILQNSKENEISIKRLRKKITNEYTLLTGKEVDDKVLSKLNKQLDKNQNIILHKDKVTLKNRE